MKSSLTRRAAALTPPDVEPMLRAAAAWEPDAAPPHDFAAFTRQALEKRERQVAWRNGFLRSPLMVGLASACVLWMGGKLSVPHQSALNAAPPVSYAAAVPFPTPAAWEAASPSAGSSPLTLASDAAREPLSEAAAPDQTARSWDYHAAAVHSTGHRRIRKSNVAHRLWDTETVLAPSPDTSAPTDTVWKTETVERPAWGALVPVPAACAVPSADAQTGEATSEPAEGEASSAILPLVLDVALPDIETPMPAPSPTPTPSPEK